ncbi:MAG: branched-chain amino acid ABC transporter permease [Candidatus Marsarchaeota archaeon]|nr:branched-chain amino acid ABC transporter permease [Candidatus Marsarchaeota archaeon]
MAAQIVNLLITGITVGSVYAIMAIGLSFVYSITNVLNYAQGAMFTWSAYIAWMLSKGYVHLPYFVVIIITLPAMLVFGFVFEKVLIAPLRRFKGWEMSAIIVTLGSALLLDNLALVLFGTPPKQIPHLAEGNLSVGRFSVTKHEFITLVVSVVIIVILIQFLKRVRAGPAMQALAQDITGSRIVGISTGRMFGYAFAIAGGLAGVAGILLAPKVLVYPSVGWLVFVKAFVVMVFGGLGSFKGTAVAAFVLATLEAFVAFYVGAIWGMPLFIVVLVVMLSIRPRGLFGRW